MQKYDEVELAPDWPVGCWFQLHHGSGALEKEQTWTETPGETWLCNGLHIFPMNICNKYFRNTFVTRSIATDFYYNAHPSLAQRVAGGSFVWWSLGLSELSGALCGSLELSM